MQHGAPQKNPKTQTSLISLKEFFFPILHSQLVNCDEEQQRALATTTAAARGANVIHQERQGRCGARLIMVAAAARGRREEGSTWLNEANNCGGTEGWMDARK